jgi:hypothetical protein
MGGVFDCRRVSSSHCFRATAVSIQNLSSVITGKENVVSLSGWSIPAQARLYFEYVAASAQEAFVGIPMILMELVNLPYPAVYALTVQTPAGHIEREVIFDRGRAQGCAFSVGSMGDYYILFRSQTPGVVGRLHHNYTYPFGADLSGDNFFSVADYLLLPTIGTDTPTATATPPATTSPPPTPLATLSVTETPLATLSVTETPLATLSVTETPSDSLSVTETPLPTPTITETPLPTPTAPQTRLDTPSVTDTPPPTPSDSAPPHATPVATPTLGWPPLGTRLGKGVPWSRPARILPLIAAIVLGLVLIGYFPAQMIMERIKKKSPRPGDAFAMRP